MIDLRLHIIPLTNTELDSAGNPIKPYAITPVEFADLVVRVNRSFEGTGIRLVFDPSTDWEPMADTQLNTDLYADLYNAASPLRERGNQIASRYSGKIVCFLRWGNEPTGNPTGNGNAFPPPGASPKPPSVNDFEQNYVALPNRIVPPYGLLNQGNGSFVAHELGHYLGLYHTFPGWSDREGPGSIFEHIPSGTPLSASVADQAVIDYIVANGGTVDALDGDLLDDTPPDPTPILFNAHSQDICAQRQIAVTGFISGRLVSFIFEPDPNNVMSYYTACGPAGAPPPPSRFSSQQVRRMLKTLLHPARRHLLPTTSITLSETDISFGSVAIGDVRDKTFTVTNTGPSDLIVSFPSHPPIRNTWFVWEHVGAFVIPPGGNLTTRLSMSPHGLGNGKDTLMITSNAAGSPHLIKLSGLGRPGPPP
ncbi:hypothetical protein [Paenibacillus dendritiformis]|uniref:Ig-like domain-containing protein n=1 Tax=Paenibacillus dendritiformis TaxID=130049 RepID=UPI000DA88ED2|nr:hypothetical protein [Paenibacillus dendritiformis]PZM67560.1 hypothetical protein DOE73_00920 [Paenibacillus dendritiformis]